MDQIKFYINPEIYKHEHNLGDTETYEKVNSEFDRQTEIGRRTGKPKSSREMQEAIAEFTKNKDSLYKKRDGVVYLSGDEGVEFSMQKKEAPEEEDTLG